MKKKTKTFTVFDVFLGTSSFKITDATSLFSVHLWTLKHIVCSHLADYLTCDVIVYMRKCKINVDSICCPIYCRITTVICGCLRITSLRICKKKKKSAKGIEFIFWKKENVKKFNLCLKINFVPTGEMLRLSGRVVTSTKYVSNVSVNYNLKLGIWQSFNTEICMD